MHRRDGIDPLLAKYFAWTFVLGGDTARLSDRLNAAEEAAAAGDADGRSMDAAVFDDAASEPIARRSRAKARAACRALAASIGEAWACDEALRDAAPGAAAAGGCGARTVKRLVVRAERLGVELLEMRGWPAESVRLLRLIVRYGPTMSRRQRERCASVATLVPVEHGEVAELLVEVARAADRLMADALLADDEWRPDVADPDALVARLADVIDQSPSHAGRVIAIELVERFERRTVAAAALKRALRLPSFAVRARAL